ncbi:MAG: hypothetical protein ACRC06_05500 [Waterburya sp.]
MNEDRNASPPQLLHRNALPPQDRARPQNNFDDLLVVHQFNFDINLQSNYDAVKFTCFVIYSTM